MSATEEWKRLRQDKHQLRSLLASARYGSLTKLAIRFGLSREALDYYRRIFGLPKFPSAEKRAYIAKVMQARRGITVASQYHPKVVGVPVVDSGFPLATSEQRHLIRVTENEGRRRKQLLRQARKGNPLAAEVLYLRYKMVGAQEWPADRLDGGNDDPSIYRAR